MSSPPSSAQPQSLRKHRQTLISAERPPLTAYGIPNMGELPSVGIKDKEKVGNLVKRRISTRLPSNTIYAIPGVPISIKEEASGSDSNNNEISDSRPPPLPQKLPAIPLSRKDKGQVDKDVFANKNFDAKSYISDNLSDATDVEISRFADKLSGLMVRLSTDKKDSIHNNYLAFLSAGKEVRILSTEISSLRDLLNQLHTATSAMREDAQQIVSSSSSSGQLGGSATAGGNSGGRRPSLAAPGNRYNNRNSVLMLENIWAQELASLFRHVEGAQKYLPAIPGRHVIMESGGWYQLNAATWKPLQPAHIFLISDHLLIAVKKRLKTDPSVAAPSQSLMADQCWPLLEIDLIDLLPSKPGAGHGALCVKSGTLNYVYRTDRNDAHDKLVQKFRRARGELQKHRDAKTDHQNGSALIESGNSSRKLAGHSREPSIDITGRSRSLREVDDLINDLDVKIAYRQFDDAVALIRAYSKEISKNEDSKDSVDIANETLQNRLKTRSQDICNILITELNSNLLSQGHTQKSLQLLISLGQEEAAKNVLLMSRQQLIRKRIKLIEFNGDIPGYIAQVAAIQFRLVLTTVQLYRSTFPSIADSSKVVEWARAEVDNFVLLFSRQLYNIKPSSNTYRKCAQIALDESLQLKSEGLEVNFLLRMIVN